MNQAQHLARHQELHASYDELIADYLRWNPEKLLANTNLLELLEWSFSQTKTPSDDDTGLRPVHAFNVCAHCGRSVTEPAHRCLLLGSEEVKTA